jgi:hypothetical protein
MAPERMAAFPAWELVRIATKSAPRNWRAGDGGTPPIFQGEADMRSRWTIAGGKPGRMIALKGDPVWGELGSSGNFDDAVDTDHPPFAFNSGMGWREISAAECAELGITGPDGETVEEWLGGEHPVIGTPPPMLSTRGVDPAMVKQITKTIPAEVTAGKITGTSTGDRLARAIARRQAEYDARPK